MTVTIDLDESAISERLTTVSDAHRFLITGLQPTRTIFVRWIPALQGSVFPDSGNRNSNGMSRMRRNNITDWAE